MAKSLYIYEIKGKQKKTFAYHGSPNPVLLQQFAIQVADEISKTKKVRIIAANSQEEADEDSKRAGGSSLLAKVTLQDVLDLMEIAPEDASPSNIASALDYTVAEYRNLLTSQEKKYLSSASKKVRKHLERLF